MGMPLFNLQKVYRLSYIIRLMKTKFKPSFVLKNKHVQTTYASFFRKLPEHNFHIEKFILSDGDFVECYWYNKPIQTNKPLVILFHGLAGSYKSPYIQGLMSKLDKDSYNSVLMHFRSCSGIINTKPIAYHSGKTDDALEFIESLKLRFTSSKFFSIGFSLGANMMLKLLGELQTNSPFSASVSVSAPMKLSLGSDKINKGLSKYYQSYLLKNLNALLEQKCELHDMKALINLEKEDVQNLKTFWEFDEAYTAPIHGFDSAKDYYDKSSAHQYLRDIHTPTLIIHSKDDPFMPEEILPKEDEISQSVELEIYENGGHVGFVNGSLFKPEYFLETRILEYFNKFN